MNRVKILQRSLNKNELFLVFNSSNIYYLTEQSVDSIIFGFTTSDVYVFCNQMIRSQAKRLFKRVKVICGDRIVEQLSKIENPIKKIIIDTKINYDTYSELQKKYRLIYSDEIYKMRQIKLKNEIFFMKKSVQMAFKVMQKVKEKLIVGISEIELKRFIIKEFLDMEVSAAFEPIVAFGENTALPHHVSSSKKLKKTDIVLIDIGCKYVGYCSDITRMFNVEKNYKIWNYYRNLIMLQEKLIGMCKAGQKISNINDFALDYCKKLGIEKNYLHSSGHGIGIDVHENPKISSENKDVLEEGMVITIEPGIYFDNKFGLRVEDMLLITKNGNILISRK